MPRETLDDLVAEKLKNLRPKLLDLSRRNPLLSTKLTPRSNSHLRVVDELPDVLFYKLNNDQQMRLVALPEIEEDPKDEQTKAFRDALTNARIVNTAYLEALEKISPDSETSIDDVRKIEREIKDEVRNNWVFRHAPRKQI